MTVLPLTGPVTARRHAPGAPQISFLRNCKFEDHQGAYFPAELSANPIVVPLN